MYLPEGSGPLPFVLGIHGGGWNSGNQESYSWLWPKLEPLGVALVLCSYRLAPEFPFPCAYDDLLRVLSWIQEHGASHRLDTTRCLLFGGSAGGHLAMLLATRGIAENSAVPEIRGVVDFCGIMDLAAQHTWDRGRASPMTREFLASDPENNPERFRAASPQENIHANMPPAWIAHGSVDPVVPVEQSRRMVRNLRKAGHDPVYLEARGLGHTMLETTRDGRTIAPAEILFEHDFLRFVRCCLKL